MQLNKANFLTWHKDGFGANTPLPMSKVKSCASALVAWRIGERMAFVFNADTLIAGSYSLSICNLDKSVVSVVGNMTLVNTYLFSETACPTVAVGDYILKIANGLVVYYSNKISIINDTDIFNTALFRFKHKFDKNGVEYTKEGVTTSWGGLYQQYRLFCSFSELNLQSSKEIINDIDSPTPREYNTLTSAGYKCSVFSLDADRHFAIQDMITCSVLEINGVTYQSDGAYSPQIIGRSGISNGTFNIQDYSLRYPKR